jgi:hypothetical protein
MISAQHGVWLLAAVAAGLVLAVLFLDLLQRLARRRARRAYFARAANESHLQSLHGDLEVPAAGIGPERAAAIRQHAERSAQHDWAAGHGSERSPHERGTPEHVLWFATYHLRIGELAEEAEAEAVTEPQPREANGRPQ